MLSGYFLLNRTSSFFSSLQIYMIYFKKPGDIDENQVRALLFEAAMIDAQFVRKKK